MFGYTIAGCYAGKELPQYDNFATNNIVLFVLLYCILLYIVLYIIIIFVLY